MKFLNYYLGFYIIIYFLSKIFVKSELFVQIADEGFWIAIAIFVLKLIPVFIKKKMIIFRKNIHTIVAITIICCR